MSSQFRLDVLIFRDGGDWVAQVLQHDMVAHGSTPQSALASVKLVIQTHVHFDLRHKRFPLSRLPKAADIYWRAFKTAERLPDSEPAALMHPAIIEAAVARQGLESAIQ